MDYKISTEFVVNHGAPISEGVSFFNFLTFADYSHCRLTKGHFDMVIDVYCDTRKEALEIHRLSKRFLGKQWKHEFRNFLDSANPFICVEYTYQIS